jgi:hypothetical protein
MEEAQWQMEEAQWQMEEAQRYSCHCHSYNKNRNKTRSTRADCTIIYKMILVNDK